MIFLTISGITAYISVLCHLHLWKIRGHILFHIATSLSNTGWWWAARWLSKHTAWKHSRKRGAKNQTQIWFMVTHAHTPHKDQSGASVGWSTQACGTPNRRQVGQCSSRNYDKYTPNRTQRKIFSHYQNVLNCSEMPLWRIGCLDRYNRRTVYLCTGLVQCSLRRKEEGADAKETWGEVEIKWGQTTWRGSDGGEHRTWW